MYIHELDDWPKFRWNQEAIFEQLIPLRRHQGLLMGKMETLGFDLRKEALLQTLTNDVIKSSEIEGEILEMPLVRSSIARRLGMDQAGLNKVDRNVEGVVEMMLDDTQNYNTILSKERLFAWHSSLFPAGYSGLSKIAVGEWRKGPIQVVSGYSGKEIIHFEGPPAGRVDKEMSAFLDWLNKENHIDQVLKACIAHLWFVTIHPFEDGNGRIGRAIADLLLARSENSTQRYYSLSAQIQLERKDYYTILEQSQKGDLEITHWLKWFLGCLRRAILGASETLSSVMYKAKFWESISNNKLNDRQKKMLNRLLDGFDGQLTTSKWAKIVKCSQDSAYRDILELVNLGILHKNPQGGRSTNYTLHKIS